MFKIVTLPLKRNENELTKDINLGKEASIRTTAGKIMGVIGVDLNSGVGFVRLKLLLTDVPCCCFI